MLGVIIGTGTIIGVSAILTGFDASITGVLRSFGPNSIIVFKFPVGFRVGNLTPEERTRKNLTYENAVHIRERCKAVEDVSPMLFPNRHASTPTTRATTCTMSISFGVEEAYAAAARWTCTWAASSATKRAAIACPWRWSAPTSRRASSPTSIPSARPSTWMATSSR